MPLNGISLWEWGVFRPSLRTSSQSIWVLGRECSAVKVTKEVAGKDSTSHPWAFMVSNGLGEEIRLSDLVTY